MSLGERPMARVLRVVEIGFDPPPHHHGLLEKGVHVWFLVFTNGYYYYYRTAPLKKYFAFQIYFFAFQILTRAAFKF